MVAHDIYNEVANSPGYWLMIEACKQALLRAHETTRRLVAENKHHRQILSAAFTEEMFPLLEAYKQ